MSATAPVPAGSNTVNPFVMTDNAADLIDFVIEVFEAEDVPDARTIDTDGLILHAELRIGDSVVVIADRKPQWPFTPAFIQVYVSDVEATLQRARRRGARIVTEATEFFGDTLARFQDPAGHLWWVQQHDAAGQADWTGDDTGWEQFSTPELEYVHTTLLETMAALRDPRG